MDDMEMDFGSEESLNSNARSTLDRGADGCLLPAAPGSSLIQSCLPALTVLEKNGVTHLSLLIHFEDGVPCDHYIREPRFLDDSRVLKKNLKEVREAFRTVCFAVERAIEAAIAGTDEEESSFFAYASLGYGDRPGGWSVDCEIEAMIDVTSPGGVIDLP